MTYRDDTASLEERHRMLRRSLDENRTRSNALKNEEAMLHRALATLHQELSDSRPKRSLPLAQIVVASPCDVPWDEMVGNDRVRHCASCQRDVHNLSSMTRDEVDAFLARADALGERGELKPCVSLFQRADGTILTADCPVGVRRRRIRGMLAATLGVGVAALMAFTALALLQGDALALRDTTGPSPILTPVPMTTNGPAMTGYGTVRVEGTPGTLVSENGQMLGVVPLTLPAATGTHAYTFVNGARSRVQTVVVPDHGIVHLDMSFDPRPVRMAGQMPRPSMMKGGL